MHILLIDDHALFRAGMRVLLQRLNKAFKLDEASSFTQAYAQLETQHYDLVLLDLGLPDNIKGLDALDGLRTITSGTPIVVISADDDPHLVRAAIEHGAMGFIPKSSTPELLIHALELVLAQGVYLPRGVLDIPFQPVPEEDAGEAKHPVLTKRQIQVLREVLTGKSNRDIAEGLNIAEATIKSHLTHVYRALGVDNRTEAVYIAAKLGLQLT